MVVASIWQTSSCGGQRQSELPASLQTIGKEYLRQSRTAGFAGSGPPVKIERSGQRHAQSDLILAGCDTLLAVNSETGLGSSTPRSRSQ